jgi:hypothetical protein
VHQVAGGDGLVQLLLGRSAPDPGLNDMKTGCESVASDRQQVVGAMLCHSDKMCCTGGAQAKGDWVLGGNGWHYRRWDIGLRVPACGVRR